MFKLKEIGSQIKNWVEDRIVDGFDAFDNNKAGGIIGFLAASTTAFALPIVAPLVGPVLIVSCVMACTAVAGVKLMHNEKKNALLTLAVSPFLPYLSLIIGGALLGALSEEKIKQVLTINHPKETPVNIAQEALTSVSGATADPGLQQNLTAITQTSFPKPLPPTANDVQAEAKALPGAKPPAM